VTTERIARNVHELAGPWYLAVLLHDPEKVGEPFILNTQVYSPVKTLIPEILDEIPAIPTNTEYHPNVDTLIIHNTARLKDQYPGQVPATYTETLNALKDNLSVNGVLIDLNDYPVVVDAYEVWDLYPTYPQAANYVARTIKAVLYSELPAYPGAEYMVIVGGDNVIPHRRIQDTTLVANERLYPYAANDFLRDAFNQRYYLSDDYYSGILPYGVAGRELYLPQYGIGRLVEKPDEIVTMIETFTVHDQTVLTPTKTLVTGYDFLVDQATAISDTLVQQGVLSLTTLINNTWTADDFRELTFDAQNYDLISLNSHFDHFRFFPNDANDVLATEFDEAAIAENFASRLIYSVGCHSALNVYADASTPWYLDSDFAQIFASQGINYIGNLGFGYGDGDLLAYSERLMLNFTEELNYYDDDLPSIGTSLLRAKHRYLNGLGAGSLTNYDEKVMAQMVLFGLPMLKVDMPVKTFDPPGGYSQLDLVGEPLPLGGPVGLQGWPESIDFLYEDIVTLTGPVRFGSYYQILNEDDLLSVGGRPVLPQTSINYNSYFSAAHGVLMVGGEFFDTPDFDPVIGNIITQEHSIEEEGFYPSQQLYPSSVASINRFATLGGELQQRLVVVPAQFQTTNTITPTKGIHRLYSSLDLVVFTYPFSETSDYIAPRISVVEAVTEPNSLNFNVEVSDDSGVYATVVLYRGASDTSWNHLYLQYNAGSATGFTTTVPTGTIEYFVQAVDNVGNVAMVLDHGQPFRLLSASDMDVDGVVDKSDNCLLTKNGDQVDTDGDTIGDACDTNKDGDAALDLFDSWPGDDGEWFDTDNDGEGNNSDKDDDNDNILDVYTDTLIPWDNCRLVPNFDQKDFDNDGKGDACDVVELTITPTVDITTTLEETPVTIKVQDNDGNFTIYARAVRYPSNGDLANLGNGTFVYTPTSYFSGEDSFDYDICIVGNGGSSACNSATVTITVIAVANTPSLEVVNTAGDEGVPIPLTITPTLADTDGSEELTIILSDLPVSATLSAGDHSGTTASLTPDLLSGLAITIPNDGTYAFTVTAVATEISNGESASFSLPLTVTVGSKLPAVSTIHITVTAIAVGEPITVSLNFTDTGTLDTHTGLWEWDDGTSCNTVSSPDIPENDCELMESDGSGVVIGTHVYTQAGFYTITVTVTDDDSQDSINVSHPDLVVYNTESGHVTGGGSIIVTDMACPLCKGNEANFGFVVQYSDGILEGETNFSFKKGGRNFFLSNSFDYLVVVGDLAQMGGQGELSDGSFVSFVITILDADIEGDDGIEIDLYGIRIWDADGDIVNTDSPDNLFSYPFGMQESIGGSIVIH
jgi:hypothetical protein